MVSGGDPLNADEVGMPKTILIHGNSPASSPLHPRAAELKTLFFQYSLHTPSRF